MTEALAEGLGQAELGNNRWERVTFSDDFRGTPSPPLGEGIAEELQLNKELI